MDPVFSRPKFGPMPSGYVPGAGRGAVPFFTRSDIGNASSPGFMIKYPPRSPTQGTRGHEHDRDRGDYSDTLFDRWSGFPDKKPHTDKPDAEDDEADKVYADVDEYLDLRRKRHREKAVVELVAKKRKPTVASLFADVKETLRSVTIGTEYLLTVEQWNEIPAAKPHARKKVKQTKKVPITDRVLYQAMTEGQILPTDQTTSNSDAVGSVIFQQLDRVGGIKTAAPSVDPVGYLTEMNAMKVSSEEEIRDLKKLRGLVKSLIDTNPTHSEGWLTAARVEEKDGKLAEARTLIATGLSHCPESEDLWLEAARLAPVYEGREMLVKGTMAMPHSVRLWMALASKSPSDPERLSTLRQALQINPESVRLWKEITHLASPEDARMYLRKAVTCIPQSLELWLALARLESYENAQAVLSKARKLMPGEFIIWVYAAKLEEANGNTENVPLLIARGIRALTKAAVVVPRPAWLQEAFTAEQAGSPLTATAIVAATLETGLDPSERVARWLEDSDAALSAACIECARSVLAGGLAILPGTVPLWTAKVRLERRVGGGLLAATYAAATSECPGEVSFWAEYAALLSSTGDRQTAIRALETGVVHHPGALPLHLQLSQLCMDVGDLLKSRAVLLQCDCGKAWKRAALLDLAENNRPAAIATLQEGIRRYPQYPRLYLLLADLHTDGELKAQTLAEGVAACAEGGEQIWAAAAKLEESRGSAIKARYVLEKARRNCRSPLLWLESVMLEKRENNEKAAKSLLTEGIKRFPGSGTLWAEAIRMEERGKKKAKIVDAMEQCEDSAEVMVEAAKAFWDERKIEKARLWFQKSVSCSQSWGDAAILYYLFETQQNTPPPPSLLAQLSSHPYKHGQIWSQTPKSLPIPDRIITGAAIAAKSLLTT